MSQALTQPQLAAKCNLLGWNISRETLAKIESQVRWISDAELLCMGKALGVSIESLLPHQERDPKNLAKFFRSTR